MDHYIGLDAHMKSCTFVVLTAKGKHVLTQRVETNGRALCSFIRSVAGIKHLCLEECELSEWLYELFYPLVTELKVVQPKKREGPKSALVISEGIPISSQSLLGSDRGNRGRPRAALWQPVRLGSVLAGTTAAATAPPAAERRCQPPGC